MENNEPVPNPGKHVIKYFLIVLAICVVLVGCMAVYFRAAIVVTPTCAEGSLGYDVSTLKDRDGVRQSSKRIGIAPLRMGDPLPKDQVQKVKRSRNYIVLSAGSRRNLVPQAKDLLEEIGREFGSRCREEGINAKFIVTSLLRTEEDNSMLAKVNGNVSQNSLHKDGTTFDITYRHFWCPDKKNASSCDKILSGVLADFRRQGKCWVLREVNQPCYHITVKPDYSRQ